MSNVSVDKIFAENRIEIYGLEEEIIDDFNNCFLIFIIKLLIILHIYYIGMLCVQESILIK